MPKQAPPKSIDDYIAGFPADVQAQLQSVRAAIRKAAPKAVEVISYRMPAFKQHGYLVFFSAYKQHIGLYGTSAEANAKYKDAVAPYAGPKGALRFPLTERMPVGLIGKLVKFRVREDIAHAKARGKKL